MKIIKTIVLTLTILAVAANIFADDEDIDPVDAFMVKCHTEWDMIVIKKYKGNDEKIASELEQNKIMASMIRDSIANWFEMKQKWEDARVEEDYELMKVAAEYCNSTRKLTMDVCPAQAKTLPILKAR